MVACVERSLHQSTARKLPQAEHHCGPSRRRRMRPGRARLRRGAPLGRKSWPGWFAVHRCWRAELMARRHLMAAMQQVSSAASHEDNSCRYGDVNKFPQLMMTRVSLLAFWEIFLHELCNSSLFPSFSMLTSA